jgi:hypothetical protein
VRVLLDLRYRDGQLTCVTTRPDETSSERSVRWAGIVARVLVERSDPISDDDADALASWTDQAGAPMSELARYGGLLFAAAFGPAAWRDLVERSAADPYLEIAILGRADQEQPVACPLQALRWEALHDGETFVMTRGVQTAAGKNVSVGIVRLVPPAPGAAGRPPHLPLTGIPRVLFAIGSRLTDPAVRPGAEFMSILRHVESQGGSITGGLIQPRVLESASLPSLARELGLFKPDVLHLIGHGQWDHNDRCVKLQLRADGTGADDYVTAGQLLGAFGDAGHVPTMVVLSACQTASPSPAGAGQAAGPVNALPFAARLVAGGVTVVAAMAGDISDTACRIFTRALTKAIGEGMPLGRAVILGRRAAFYQQHDPDSADWMMPALFLAEGVPAETRLVDTTASWAVKERTRMLNLVWGPVFYGRGDFITAMDRLLDERDPLNVLVAHTPDPDQSYGGTRLLRELAARAVQSGRLPVLLGPYEKDPPTDRRQLAREISRGLTTMRRRLGLTDELGPRTADVVAAAQGATAEDLAVAIRHDLDALVRDLPVSDPVLASPYPRIMLLCHRVDRWLDALDDLLDMLDPQGLGPGPHSVPVVMTGADSGEQGRPLKDARLSRYRDASWIKFAPLDRLSGGAADPAVWGAEAPEAEDILAYQWWLLNPPEQVPVYAPKRGGSLDWHDQLRWVMQTYAPSLYDKQALFGFAKSHHVYFTENMDSDMLTSFAKVAP